MTSMFRRTASAFLLAFASTSTALAFPPCPVDDAEIVPLDAASGLAFAAPWKVAITSNVGTLQPESIVTACRHIPGAPNAGECKIDLFPLDGLAPRSTGGAIGTSPAYSPQSQVGVVALPDVRSQGAAERNLQYALTLGINAMPLAHPGDWIDIAQLEFVADAAEAPNVVFRLRKYTRPDGRAEVRLIRARPDGRPDLVLAAVPLSAKSPVSPIVLRWKPTVEARYGIPAGSGGDDLGMPVPSYSVDTALSLEVDGATQYATKVDGQMPSIASMGLLDYNLPVQDEVQIELPGSPIPPADPFVPGGPGLNAVEAIDMPATDVVPNPYEYVLSLDTPGALLAFYYTQFSVVAR